MLVLVCVSGRRVASHTRSLFYVRHPAGAGEKCTNGERAPNTIMINLPSCPESWTCPFISLWRWFNWCLFLQFELFYNQHFSGRKLTWLHYLCTGNVARAETHTQNDWRRKDIYLIWSYIFTGFLFFLHLFGHIILYFIVCFFLHLFWHITI